MKKILFVDDERMNLMLFSVNYKNKFTVLTADSADEAMQLLRQHPDIDVVITDMKMPDVNGLELAAMIRAESPSMRVFLLTGFELLPEIEQAITDGLICGYINKPLNFKQLENIIGLNE
ncbi:MAG: response regulator [Bacteroidales bacterium]|nr:response regulator [Bacteroidales bacterium]